MILIDSIYDISFVGQTGDDSRKPRYTIRAILEKIVDGDGVFKKIDTLFDHGNWVTEGKGDYSYTLTHFTGPDNSHTIEFYGDRNSHPELYL